ncbi:right-handed parallel beta-helix repeat-containing protein [Curtobacterium pusillum]|uniref:Right handed beta helix domain-containing protein n=1 Tax=Curtobacterium pusillum TaxID=69373 RepID=A0ABX2M8X5_9MICO|nr:right-handed parallel beta-helix repeat-containing protein [Curtobacterium pusillum]NUU14311.1 hypothetical protein [Curtobacterium pusillum]
MTTTEDAIVVTASEVSIVDPDVSGAGADGGGLGRGVVFLGTPGAPIRSASVIGGRLRDLPHDGVHLAYCDGFDVSRTEITRTGYSGVLVIGGVDGVVQDCVISDIRQPAGRVNSYGISISRDATQDVSITRRSARVRVLRNRVSDVPAWEGIDTHAGDQVEIRDNVVSGCRVGIAAVPSKDPGDRTETAAAPLRLVVEGNEITKAPGAQPGPGIVVSGAGTTVGSSRERATGTVGANTVRGGGGGADEGAILVKLSRGFVVRDNVIVDSGTAAVALPHSNDGIEVSGNTVRNVSGSGMGVNVIDGANSGAITGNRFEPSSPTLRVAVRFGPLPSAFTVRQNSYGTATVQVAPGGATISS